MQTTCETGWIDELIRDYKELDCSCRRGQLSVDKDQYRLLIDKEIKTLFDAQKIQLHKGCLYQVDRSEHLYAHCIITTCTLGDLGQLERLMEAQNVKMWITVAKLQLTESISWLCCPYYCLEKKNDDLNDPYRLSIVRPIPVRNEVADGGFLSIGHTLVMEDLALIRLASRSGLHRIDNHIGTVFNLISRLSPSLAFKKEIKQLCECYHEFDDSETFDRPLTAEFSRTRLIINKPFARDCRQKNIPLLKNFSYRVGGDDSFFRYALIQLDSLNHQELAYVANTLKKRKVLSQVKMNETTVSFPRPVFLMEKSPSGDRNRYDLCNHTTAAIRVQEAIIGDEYLFSDRHQFESHQPSLNAEFSGRVVVDISKKFLESFVIKDEPVMPLNFNERKILCGSDAVGNIDVKY